jgi:predicted butyrate kinase (DUF1464 family)
VVIAAGIDAGTWSYDIFALKDGKPHFSTSLPTSEVRKNPKLLLDVISDVNADFIVGPSGYGLPVKKFSELSDEDVFLMTLNRDKNTAMGLRTLIDLARKENLNMYTIPAVIHLPTVPFWRKLNQIDMGTSDKLCSVALALYQLAEPYEDQSFVLVEAGYGFNAFIAVDGGKVVDGIGGTSGFPSFSSLGSVDGELAYLLSDFPKSMLFSGGVRSLARDRGIEIDEVEKITAEMSEWLCEFIMKGVRAVEVSTRSDLLVVSGRLFDVPEFERLFTEKVEEFGYEVIRLKGFGYAKQSAEGAAIIADGLAEGVFEEIVDHLEVRRASGTVLDYITSDISIYLDI